MRRDDWWAALVLAEFSFLDDLGYMSTGSEWAGVHFHHNGHYVAFVGRRRDVVIEYDPDDPARVTIGARVLDHHPPKAISLDVLIAQHLPGEQPPSRVPLDRGAIEANVRWWAKCLGRIAPEIL